MSGRLPVRWRLALWYAALVAATLVLAGIGAYQVVRSSALSAFDEQLGDQALLALAVVESGLANGLPRGELPAGDDDLYVRIFDAEGRVVAGTRAALDVTLGPGAEVTSALAGHTSFGHLAVDGELRRVATLAVRDEAGAVAGAIQVGLPSDELDEALEAAVAPLAVAFPLAVAIFVALGLLLAGRALAPLTALAREAERIDGRHPGTRLELPLPDDELGNLARTINRMLGRIDATFDRQRRFVGDAAHELRTPLALMRGEIDLALSRPRAADDYRASLRALLGDVDRLSVLTAALLSLARSDAGRLVVDAAPMDLADTIDAVRDQYADAAAEAGIELRNETTPTACLADEGAIVQVLVNLVDNALAHTPHHGVVTIGCGRDGDEVRLWVADTGPGIPAHHRDRVFDRFYRIDGGLAHRGGGAGLGLAICRAIAEAHGGAIMVADSPRGARIEMRFPAARP